MGASNNKGINKSNTQFVFIINPDTVFKNETIENIFNEAKLIDDFAIISPVNTDINHPNYKISNKIFNENIIEADSVDGFAMLINKKKFEENNFFDESFFLFLENDDLCKRVKTKGNKIYVIKNAFVDHKGFSSSTKTDKEELEYLRNWHWMWSKFYFNKKHYGFFKSFVSILPSFLSSILKILIFTVLFNKKKRKIYQFRFSGILNSIAGKNSWYRIKD
jgi:Predicted glycosyltransferases